MTNVRNEEKSVKVGEKWERWRRHEELYRMERRQGERNAKRKIKNRP